MLAERFDKAAALMGRAKEEVLAFRTFPQVHWRQIWSTNPLERLNKEIKRRSGVVGISSQRSRRHSSLRCRRPRHQRRMGFIRTPLLSQRPLWQISTRRRDDDGTRHPESLCPLSDRHRG